MRSGHIFRWQARRQGRYACAMQTKAALRTVLSLFLAAPCVGAQTVPDTTLDQFLRGNDQLAMKLLEGEQRKLPGRNAVVAPLSITMV